MKKMRFLAVLLAVICLAMPLSACNNQSNSGDALVDNIFDLTYTQTPDPQLTQYGKVVGINQYTDTYDITVVGTNKTGDLVYLNGTPNEQGIVEDLVDGDEATIQNLVMVYNLKTDKILFEEEYDVTKIDTDNDGNVTTTAKNIEISFSYINGDTESEVTTGSFFTVKTTTTVTKSYNEMTTVTVSLYDNTGKSHQTMTKDTSVIRLGPCIYTFGQKVYMIKDGQITFLDTYPAYNEAVFFDEYVGGYFYVIENRKVLVYDKNMSLVYGWDCDAADTTLDFYVLNNGHILVESFTTLHEDAEAYEILEDNVKYNYDHLLLDPVAKTETALELDFIIEHLVARNSLEENGSDFDILNKEIQNFATIIYVADQKLDYDSATSVALSDEAEVVATLAPVDSYDKMQTPYAFGNGYFAVWVDKQTYVFDKEGKQVGVYTGEMHQLDKFLVTEDERYIYNYQLQEIYALDDYTTIEYMGDDYIILLKQTMDKAQYIYFDGAEKVLFTLDRTNDDTDEDTIETHVCLDRFYVKAKMTYNGLDVPDITFTCYDFSGNVLCVEDVFLDAVAETSNAILLQDTEGNFHRISG